MKKYGDDADQFHNQGTRVEASKKWHEQHQQRYDYSYYTPSRPKSPYKPKSSYKYDSKYKKTSNASYIPGRMLKKCPECGSLIPSTDKKCSYCNTYIKSEIQPKLSSTYNYKPNTTYKRDPNELIICPECGHYYGSYFDSCPHCKSNLNSIDVNNNRLGIYCVGIIIIFALLAIIFLYL